MSKPKSVIFLIIWFIWSAGKDLDGLVRYSITSDFYILSSAGLPWLYFVMALAVFLLDMAAVYYLFRPQAAGVRVLFCALAAAFVQNLVTLALALRDIAGVREAYARGRELRGLPVREDALDMIFTQRGMLMSAVIMFCLYVLVAFVVHRNRTYFHRTTGIAEI